MQVDYKLIHAYATGNAHNFRSLSGFDAHWTAKFIHMPSANQIKARSRAVNTISIPNRHNRRAGSGIGDIGTSVGNTLTSVHVFNRAELRLQRHRRL